MSNVYVDGESHFIRSEACLQKRHGIEIALESAEYIPTAVGTPSYPDETYPILRVDRRCKFFWDRQYVPFLDDFRLHSIRGIRNAVYFSSASGDENLLHNVRTLVRQEGFEPQIVMERRQLACQRGTQLTTNQLIYKAKGVDIGLAVRLLEDAYLGVFDECFLFTSDVDFVPAIEIARRLGRKVYVCGYKDGIGKNSALEYVPDRFIDLEDRLRQYKLRGLP